MVYITGDLHGDITRFRSKEFRKLKRKDTLIICGDFGFLWDGSDKEKKVLEWIGKRNFDVLFVEGVHDNLNLLSKYPMEEWNGGLCRHISGGLRQLCRGSIFTIERRRIFAFGGGEDSDAESHDIQSEWWDKELPSPQETAEARKNLEAVGNRVDYIVTHQCRRKLKKLLTMEENDVNVLDTFFDEIHEKCDYKAWFFGSYHIDKPIPPNAVALFQKVVPIAEGEFSIGRINPVNMG